MFRRLCCPWILCSVMLPHSTLTEWLFRALRQILNSSQKFVYAALLLFTLIFAALGALPSVCIRRRFHFPPAPRLDPHLCLVPAPLSALPLSSAAHLDALPAPALAGSGTFPPRLKNRKWRQIVSNDELIKLAVPGTEQSAKAYGVSAFVRFQPDSWATSCELFTVLLHVF